MAKLTDEMKTLFETQLAIVSTATKEGVPNAVPKGSLFVVDDQTLCYGEGTGAKTLSNLQANPMVSVLIFDRASGNGFQVKGRSELVTGGEVFQKMVKRQEERKKPAPKVVVKINADEIYSIKMGMAGKRVA
jgi:uncharacterized protein